jgi:hypothetical protein
VILLANLALASASGRRLVDLKGCVLELGIFVTESRCTAMDVAQILGGIEGSRC